MRKHVVWSIVIAIAAIMALMGQSAGQPVMPGNDRAGELTSGQGNASLYSFLQNQTGAVLAPLHRSGSTIEGKYLSFDVDPSTGVVSNYSVTEHGGVRVFDRIAFPGMPASGNITGALYSAMGFHSAFYAHNDPSAAVHIVSSEPTSINMTMAKGWSASPLPSTLSSTQAWLMSMQNTIGLLLVNNGTASFRPASSGADGAQAGSFIDVNLSTEGTVVFQLLPTIEGISPSNQDALLRALSDWAVEAEMRAATVDNATAWEVIEYGWGVSAVTSASMENLTISVSTVMAPPGSLSPPSRTSGSYNATSPNNGTMPPPLPAALLTADQPARPGGLAYIITVSNGTMGSGTQVAVDGQALLRTENIADVLRPGSTMYLALPGSGLTKFVIPINATGSFTISLEAPPGQPGL